MLSERRRAGRRGFFFATALAKAPCSRPNCSLPDQLEQNSGAVSTVAGERAQTPEQLHAVGLSTRGSLLAPMAQCWALDPPTPLPRSGPVHGTSARGRGCSPAPRFVLIASSTFTASHGEDGPYMRT
jgi:hypothetical protein